MPEPVRLAEKLAAFDEHWSPRIVAGFNSHDVMVVKAKGDFVWHSPPDSDDFFRVLRRLASRGALRPRTPNLLIPG